MPVRIFALFLFVQLALCSTTVWAAVGKVADAPAIELSQGGEPAAGQRQPDTAMAGGRDAEGASGETSPEETAEAAGPADAAEVQPAAATGAHHGASSAPASAEQPPVPWWREAAAFLGLASDPRPGEVADAAPGRPELAPDYVVGPGDVLGISVWRDETLSRSVVVLPDGKISYPLVGEILAGGKTLAQLKGELEGKLSRYVTEAGLTVEVKQCNSMFIYTIGRVNVPGRHALLAPTNLLQALAMAGGVNPFARRDEVKVFRRQGDKTLVYSFDYDEVAEGRHLETNIELQRGDVVIVP